MWQQIISDIKKGENLDLYVTLTLAVLLAALKPIFGLFGVNISSSDLVALNMSVLAAMTIVLLVNRKRMESLERLLGRTDMMRSFPDSYIENLSNARKIFQIGTHLASNLNNYHEQYELALEKTCSSIRFLIVSPKATALTMAALRFPGGTGSEWMDNVRNQEIERTRWTISVISQLMNKYPKKIELRAIDYLFAYSSLLIETTNGHEVIYLERYTFRHSGGSNKPKFTYTPDNPWFQFIKTEMEELWDAAEPYQPVV